MNSKRSFLKNLMLMVSGGATGSLFTLITIPIISRLFNPSDFGVGALFVALGTVVGTVAPLRFERASILAKEDQEASSLTALSLVCSIAVSLFLMITIATLFLFGVAPYQGQLGNWVLLIPICILVVGINTTMEMCLLRQEKFRKVALVDALDPIVNGSSRLVLGSIFGSAIWPLIGSIFLGFFTRMTILASSSIGSLKFKREQLGWTHLKDLAKKYRDFPLVNAPAALVNRLSSDLPLLLFGLLFSPAIVGFYAIAMRILQAPVVVGSNAVRKVYHHKAAASFRSNQPIIPGLLKILLLTAGSGAIPFGVVFLFGEEIITMLLGDKWHQAGGYCEILTPWVYSLWVSTPCSVIIEVLRKQKTWLKLQLFHVTTRAAVFAWAYWTGQTPIVLLEAFVVVCVIGSAAALAIGLYFTREHDRKLKLHL